MKGLHVRIVRRGGALRLPLGTFGWVVATRRRSGETEHRVVVSGHPGMVRWCPQSCLAVAVSHLWRLIRDEIAPIDQALLLQTSLPSQFVPKCSPEQIVGLLMRFADGPHRLRSARLAESSREGEE
ncbi:MAG: hypothetical protein ACKO5K_07180 [Armatimonadota bacterium]